MIAGADRSRSRISAEGPRGGDRWCVAGAPAQGRAPADRPRQAVPARGAGRGQARRARRPRGAARGSAWRRASWRWRRTDSRSRTACSRTRSRSCTVQHPSATRRARYTHRRALEQVVQSGVGDLGVGPDPVEPERARSSRSAGGVRRGPAAHRPLANGRCPYRSRHWPTADPVLFRSTTACTSSSRSAARGPGPRCVALGAHGRRWRPRLRSPPRAWVVTFLPDNIVPDGLGAVRAEQAVLVPRDCRLHPPRSPPRWSRRSWRSSVPQPWKLSLPNAAVIAV